MSENKKGMLRHVDILGRVVIPREVRKTLRIKYGDLMEFCAYDSRQVIMRKFHLIGEIAPLVGKIVELARIGAECDIAILDTEKVVCWNGDTSGELGEIDDEIRQLMDNRRAIVQRDLHLGTRNLEGDSYFQPILCQGDLLGAVVVRAGDEQTMQKVAHLIAEFLASYFGE